MRALLCEGNHQRLLGYGRAVKRRRLDNCFIRNDVGGGEALNRQALSWCRFAQCVDELGRPRAKEYIWRMGGKVVNHVSSSNWTIDPVTLETEGNISCVAKNPVGLGIPDFIDVEVFGKFCSISMKTNSRCMLIQRTYMHICSNCFTQLVRKHVSSEE